MRNRIRENAADKERTLPTIVPFSAGQQLGMEMCDLQSLSECGAIFQGAVQRSRGLCGPRPADVIGAGEDQENREEEQP
jgi:hypothetical protein